MIIIIPLVYFYSALKGDLVLVQGDGWTANLGLRLLVGKFLQQGEIPLWNPYIFSGMPLLASIYPGSLYPPNWIFVVLSSGIAINLVVITTYHLAILGSYRYARALGFDRVAALLVGVMFAFGGFMVTSMGQTATIATACWLPWILLAIEKLYRKPSRWWLIGGAIFIALQFFGGVPQMTWYTALVAGAYFLFSAALREQNHSRVRFVSSVLIMAIGGALLSAIQLLPLRELQQQSGRASITYDYFSAYSFPPRQSLSLIFPYMFGGASQYPYKMPYWGDWGIFVTCGYVGLLGLLLALVAVLSKRNLVLWFWVGAACISLLLSFGSYLPFGANHLLYQIPIYNLFRGSFRHMLEFNFSCAVLAGIGMNYLRECGNTERYKLLKTSVSILVLGILSALLFYKVVGGQMAARTMPMGFGNSLLSAEILIPLLFAALSIAALWFYVKAPSILSGALIVLVLMCDIAAYGHALEWKSYRFSVAERLADPPSVQFIKSREVNLNSFRMMSYAAWPWENYEALNYPNNSIARGLQSANGYDMLRLTRPAIVMGDMSPDGVVQDVESFGTSDQGLNLFNVKYLFAEQNGALGDGKTVSYGGVRFRETYLDLRLAPATHHEIELAGVTASEVVIVSAMSNSTHIPDGVTIAKISIYSKDGKIIERELKIGRDTSEWAYDRSDVRNVIKHARSLVIESRPVSDENGNFEGHRYLARVPFERTEIEKIRLDYVAQDAEILIARASLYDSANGLSYPLDSLQFPPDRWRKLASFGQIDLYENQKAMPRAWFVKKVIAIPEEQILKTIKSGITPDGLRFDPSEIALLESKNLAVNKGLPSAEEREDAEISMVKYESRKIELKARNATARFLVLSEVFYPGWSALVDGANVNIYRTNYAMRGIWVPPGKHKIEFLYNPDSFKRGATYSGFGVVFLLVAVIFGRRYLFLPVKN